jgi:hypothetical protein
MHGRLPTTRRLIVAWALLMALTAATMVWGRAASGDATPLGIAWVAALLAVTFFKASRVLMVYLNLRLSTQGWKVMFHAFLVAILLPILGAYAIAGKLHLPPRPTSSATDFSPESRARPGEGLSHPISDRH